MRQKPWICQEATKIKLEAGERKRRKREKYFPPQNQQHKNFLKKHTISKIAVVGARMRASESLSLRSYEGVRGEKK